MSLETEKWYWQNIKLLAYLMPQSTISFDDEHGTWIRIERFPLPDNFAQYSSTLLLLLPGIDSPISAMPRHFYMDQHLVSRTGGMLAHMFDRAGDISELGYAWYCLHLQRWNPSPNVTEGDNFATIVYTIYHKLKEL